MNKTVNFYGTREKKCGCEFLFYDFNSKYKANKQNR